MVKARYVGRTYKDFFGTAPYEVFEGTWGMLINDRDGDNYYFYRNGKLEKDWEWVQDNTSWTTKDGKRVLVREMINSHLLNLIPFIMRGGGFDKLVTRKLGEAIIREVENRRLKTRVSKEDFISVCEQREEMFHMYMSAMELELSGD